jgi:hypothetical protein
MYSNAKQNKQNKMKQTKTNKMKRFNKVITIEVSVDNIANELRNKLVDSFPHGDLVVETIIGSSNEQQLSLLYNSLNGFTNEIDFKVGDKVRPTNLHSYGFWCQEDIDKNDSSNKRIEEAIIDEIDIYAPKKLKVKFLVPNKDNIMEYRYHTIKHTECELIVDSQAQVIEAIVDKF